MKICVVLFSIFLHNTLSIKSVTAGITLSELKRSIYYDESELPFSVF